MAELREFQSAAVERIVSRLTDAEGSRRFLLADEVGLGKTLVARGVIDKLRRRRSDAGFTIVYVCSNGEIADQNRDKLCDEEESSVPGRLTLMALQSRDIERRRGSGQIQVFAFTPGTSLRLEHGTGIARERRLLLYLLFRIWRKPVGKRTWREFFRCNAGEERWLEETRFRRLKEDFHRCIAGDLQSRLKAQWESQQVFLLNPETGDEEKPALVNCIDACVEQFTRNPRTRQFSRKNRNSIIGELRKGLARVSLEFLQPQLTILDEFQKFSDILEQSVDERSIVGKLFAKKSGAILILSATPYKMYTLAHEKENHHEDFLKTLAFLWNEPPAGSRLGGMKNDLQAFRERLELKQWATADDPVLVDLRARIERQLKEVMCRTERNWYLEDAAKGVCEVNAQGVLPQKSELIEYVHLRQFLLAHKVGDWNITDFWKSSPSALSFMDGQYGLIDRLRRDRMSLPAKVLRPTTELTKLASENAKFRQLFTKVFDEANVKNAAGGWKYLWVRPNYTYYKDSFYAEAEPTKYLVFSHWRFVPKAISILTSQEALKRIGESQRTLQSTPLQFREKIAFYPFDVCYPSLALADCVDQLQLGSSGADQLRHETLFATARSKIEALLSGSGIGFGTTRTAPLWKIIARVEARSSFKLQIRAGLMLARGWKPEENSEYLPSHVQQYLEWMEDDSPLSISPIWLDRLTHIALYSPAVALLRTFQSVFPELPVRAWGNALEFCLGPLRHYFNKRLVQTLIRRHGSGRSYTENVLSYCQQAHFQAVLDEYGYLVCHVLQQNDAEDWKSSTNSSSRDQPTRFPRSRFLDHIGRAMGMWSGLPGVNERTPSGHISARPRPQQAHFSLAFGDDVSNESADADGKTRKSAVREAFNSPFWPFVLATTSVGQEGLDFHLYCRDIVHWNLPSNPVDLEQREGRINRYDGLAIRRNIASDFPLPMVRSRTRENLWNSVFRVVAEGSHANGRFKHGLFPHWIYQSKQGNNASAAVDRSIIRRHLLFYAGSTDRHRYTELKNALAWYRLVFGQPRQQDILDKVLAQHPTTDLVGLNRSLAKYMINLSPFSPDHAYHRANLEADRLLRNPKTLNDLLDDLPRYLAQIPQSVLQQLEGAVADLIAVARERGSGGDERRRQIALAALLYLLDPYDQVHDRHGAMGYTDDLAIVRKAHQNTCRKMQ